MRLISALITCVRSAPAHSAPPWPLPRPVCSEYESKRVLSRRERVCEWQSEKTNGTMGVQNTLSVYVDATVLMGERRFSRWYRGATGSYTSIDL
jgi:hypothetical protein